MRSFIGIVVTMAGTFYIDSFLVSGLGLCVVYGGAGMDDLDGFF